jgi:undecaprenyl-diphosphatase
MELLHAAVLGIIQGLTEFLPVSSSGHLVVVPWIFGWRDMGLTFDVALHVGTLAALGIYFWNDWIDILKKWREPFVWLINIGCIPAAVFGYKFDKYFETVFRSPVLVAVFMIFMGFLMMAAEKTGKKVRELGTVNLGDSLIIGFSQVLALMPGVSRSGITITAGLFTGLTREAAARFSFLLAMPIVAGAALLKLRHVIVDGIPHDEYAPFALGIICSAIFGFLAIKYLLHYLQKHTLYIFVWYRFVLGALILMLYSLRFINS